MTSGALLISTERLAATQAKAGGRPERRQRCEAGRRPGWRASTQSEQRRKESMANHTNTCEAHLPVARASTITKPTCNRGMPHGRWFAKHRRASPLARCCGQSPHRGSVEYTTVFFKKYTGGRLTAWLTANTCPLQSYTYYYVFMISIDSIVIASYLAPVGV